MTGNITYFGWNNVTTTHIYIGICILLLYNYIIFGDILSYLVNNNCQIAKIVTGCFYSPNTDFIKNYVKLKGKTVSNTYYLDSWVQNKNFLNQCKNELSFEDGDESCVINYWEFYHIITHIFIGLFGNFYISTTLGIGFEIYEHYVYDCASIFDLLFNLIGFSIGYALRLTFNI